MLELAGITLDVDLPGKEGMENATYDMLLHLKWATDYDDIIEELASQNLKHLLSKPKSN